jgi:hypothetical protein
MSRWIVLLSSKRGELLFRKVVVLFVIGFVAVPSGAAQHSLPQHAPLMKPM